jgi:2-polyprenyl-6-methoxyphenol hydroxylase-like FAD-dependent oxidoreductase
MAKSQAAEKVLIVGGGIAGMALALALQQGGSAAELIELNSGGPLAGLGIALGGPALRALKAIDVLDSCVANGFGYSFFNVADADGRVTGTVQLPRLNGPDYPGAIGITRQALHSVLHAALTEAAVPMRLGVTVSSLDQNEAGVAVRFTDGTFDRYDLVVGADGASSKIRDMLFGTHLRPKYTGQAVWRATVSRPPEVQSRTSYHGPRNKAGYNPLSEREMYFYLVQNLPEFERLPDERLPEVLRELLADFGGLIGAARAEIEDPQKIVYRPITSALVPAPWYSGRIVLIGDAAHTTTPHMAAGAGIAIEDAIVLAQLLRSESSIPVALDKFMTRRFDRCRAVVENSFQLGEWEKAPNTAGANPVRVEAETIQLLAEPF